MNVAKVILVAGTNQPRIRKLRELNLEHRRIINTGGPGNEQTCRASISTLRTANQAADTRLWTSVVRPIDLLERRK